MGDWVILQSGPALRLLGNHTFANPPSHLSAPLPLDDDLMVHIEVFIVCTERLVCTWYVPINNTSKNTSSVSQVKAILLESQVMHRSSKCDTRKLEFGNHKWLLYYQQLQWCFHVSMVIMILTGRKWPKLSTWNDKCIDVKTLVFLLKTHIHVFLSG